MKLIHPRRTRAFRPYGRKDLDRIPQIQRLPERDRVVMKAVSAVLPFRTNAYVCDELIDWDRVPDDPLFQLTFPQPGMLEPEQLEWMVDLVRGGAPEADIQAAAGAIRRSLNPHPAGQLDLNVPHLDGEPVRGMQHKYRETALVFPGQGQTCHAFCTYCFRWAQFAGPDDLRFALTDPDVVVRYLRRHPEITSVLLTGGDPMVMRTKLLQRYVEPLLAVESLRSIRIGTKSLAWWPQRFVSDSDADDLLRLFERTVESGKTLAVMAHWSHGRELEPEVAREAVRRVRATGAVIRGQAPLIRHVNDDADVWADMWRQQVSLGAVPYYMFVERDTGAKAYFEVPLARALEIFQGAYSQVSGLARTVRGPSMSATPGKVLVEGVTEIRGQKLFVLKFVQGREPDWVNRIFFAEYDPDATWLHHLRPALGQREFFFEPRMREIRREAAARAGVEPLHLVPPSEQPASPAVAGEPAAETAGRGPHH